jgi:transcriptional regulator with XRE-family HTH domain
MSATPDGIERIRAKMRAKDWTQERLADGAKLSLVTVKRFLKLENADISTIKAIAAALELSPEAIVDAIHWQRRVVSKVIDTPSEELVVDPELVANETFYIERANTEAQCYTELIQPGALIRIKAPQLMGKTWFIEKVLAQVSQDESYQRLDIEIDRQALTSLEDFYQWFCAVASEGLELPVQLDTYWKGLTPNGDITNYFQKYLLKQIADAQQSLILVLDKVDRVFESTAIANAFCELLRGWHEQPIKGNAQNRRLWRKLRLVIIHSTEVYGSLDINYSPLGSVGIDFKLSEFNQNQVQELAQRYQLFWGETEVLKLMNLVNGHPYLVHLAISKVSRQSALLDQILNEAHTEVGIYADHLRQLAISLERSPELKNLYTEIVIANKPMPLKSVQAFKLDSMGLIQIKPSPAGENLAEPRCRLYGDFFRNHFSH